MPAVPADEADKDDEDVPTIDDGLPVHEAEPEDGDDTGDRIELVRTGLIRVYVAGTRYRLRRPFFGEFKRLRLAVEDMNDEIGDLSTEAAEVAKQIVDESRELDAKQDPEKYLQWSLESKRRQRTLGRKLTDEAERLRIEWWTDVWKTLGMDGVPDDLPSWVTNPQLPNMLLTHWRQVPSGRG